MAVLAASAQHRRQVRDQQPWMCLGGRVKMLAHPEVGAYGAGAEPAAAAFGQVRRVGVLGQAEAVAVEGHGPLPPAGRHWELYVIGLDESHLCVLQRTP